VWVRVWQTVPVRVEVPVREAPAVASSGHRRERRRRAERAGAHRSDRAMIGLLIALWRALVGGHKEAGKLARVDMPSPLGRPPEMFAEYREPDLDARRRKAIPVMGESRYQRQHPEHSPNGSGLLPGGAVPPAPPGPSFSTMRELPGDTPSGAICYLGRESRFRVCLNQS
jgi:hypothetical protein